MSSSALVSPYGSWQVPPCNIDLVLPWRGRTARSFTGTCVLCPAEQLSVGMEAASLVSSSGMRWDFEVLCLGMGCVGFSVPSGFIAVTASASIQSQWCAVPFTVRLLHLQTLLGRPLW